MNTIKYKHAAMLLGVTVVSACGGSGGDKGDNGDSSDSVAPVLSVSTSQHIFKEQTNIQFTATDNLDNAPQIYINDELYSAGDDFEIKSSQTVKAYAQDASGNRSEIFEQSYFIDTQAPKLTLEHIGGPSEHKLSAVVSDDSDPAVELKYRNAGGQWQTYTETILFSNSVDYEFVATDHAGRETTERFSIEIESDCFSDTEAPEIVITPSGLEFKDEIDLQISILDDSYAQLSINGAVYNKKNYLVDEDKTELKISAEDSCGNVSKTLTKLYRIDKKAPDISFQPAGHTFAKATEILVTVSDDVDDAPELEYRIDGGSLTTYNKPILIDEDQEIEFIATDKYGRETVLDKVYSISENADTQAPELSFSSDELVFKNGTSIQITASDNQDSAPIIMLNGELYKAGTDIEIDATNSSISVYAEDESGNRSETITKQYKLDLQPPELVLTPDGETFSGPVTVSVSAQDDTDDEPKLFYAVNGGSFEEYMGPIKISENKSIEFKAVDQFDRETLISKSYTISPVVEVKKPVIYQLVVRYFGNINSTNKTDGTIEENGSGKFNDINDAALSELKKMGITHIYLTGVIQQSTATDYSSIGQPADDTDILKGLAGSFFAIRDYFDVSPDYAVDPENRLDEFKDLIDRIHSHGMKAMIDFVPNHVSRNYETDIKPQFNFGASDEQTQFFSNQNNFFYYLDDSNPLRLPTDNSPTCGVINANPNLPNCDQAFARETGQSGKRVKVTGLDDYTSSPGVNSWYETVKLNYGYNFRDGSSQFSPQPKTWAMMNEVVKYWQELGVDGFRTDFSHVVPNEFWQYLISEAKGRGDMLFVGEAYASNDHFASMLDAGFDYLYDDPTYDLLKSIVGGSKWAQDLDKRMTEKGSGEYLPENLRGRLLRYAENHDEKRIAYRVSGSPDDSGFGSAKAGIPVSTVLYTLGGGPVLMLNGQEVGEPAEGQEGFDADNGHSSIFDYWSMPEMRKWVNNHQYDGGQLSSEQKELRAFYSKLFPLLQMEAISEGTFYGLNWANQQSQFGQYVYSYIRHTDNQQVLVVVNFGHSQINTHVKVPSETLSYTKVSQDPIKMHDLLSDEPAQTISASDISNGGLSVELAPLSAKIYLFE